MTDIKEEYLRPAPPTKKYGWAGATPFFVIHLLALASPLVGFTWTSVALCLGLFWMKMFAVTAGYHRYFAHRTYSTSRPMQFVLAFLAQTTAQKGALWWAAHHRRHHMYSDKPEDVHSPKDGFWHSHMMWLFDATEQTDWRRIKDLSKYPELVWLNKWGLMPAFVLAFVCFAIDGWSGVFVGFFLSTVMSWHATFTINSLSHVFGSRRFETTDTSRNNLWLALLTWGEGWHNNHHHYMHSTRQGIYWWEIDLTYMVLKAMSWVGLVSDLKEPPPRVYEEARLAAEKKRAGKKLLAAPATVATSISPAA